MRKKLSFLWQNKKMMEVFIMKKAIAILLSLTMILGLAACGNSASQTEKPSTEDTSVESKADTNSAENSTDKENTDNQDVQDHKVLVAYFSATGTTKGVAEHIANGLNADIYEIVPEDPYTDADLNYNDNNSRTTIEMNDPNARPAISGSVENMEQYDIIFVGYPIWWGEAPRIVSTFMESYDFSGKTIVPFCTSGGSGIGSSASNLERLTSGATWLDGRRLNGSDSQDTVMEWVNSLDLNLAE
jgi:flavodoxin